MQKKNVKMKQLGVKPPSPIATRMRQKKVVKNIAGYAKVVVSNQNTDFTIPWLYKVYFFFSQMKVQRRNVKTKKVGVKPPSPTATQMWQKKNVKNTVVLVKVWLSHKK